jgi:hypothetical protein
MERLCLTLRPNLNIPATLRWPTRFFRGDGRLHSASASRFWAGIGKFWKINTLYMIALNHCIIIFVLCLNMSFNAHSINVVRSRWAFYRRSILTSKDMRNPGNSRFNGARQYTCITNKIFNNFPLRGARANRLPSAVVRMLQFRSRRRLLSFFASRITEYSAK